MAVKKIEKRIIKGYKIRESSYKKAMKRASKSKLSLATLIEVWVLAYANNIPYLIESNTVTNKQI